MSPEQKAAEAKAIADVRTKAIASGVKVTTVTGQGGLTVYQLVDAQGDYLISHTSESALWKRAFKRGLLPGQAG